MKALAALLLAALAPCWAAVPLHTYRDLLTKAQADPASAFSEFARLHDKPYLEDDTELAVRRSIFQANVAKILAHNARNDVTYQLGLNAHADLTTEEFRLRYFGARPADIAEIRAEAENKERRPKGKPFPYSEEVPPARSNWVEEGMITHVKDQHMNNMPCGCCYAFGGMAGIEAANALYTGELVTLSEQEIVDCDELDYGCDGGDFSNVFEWVKANGGVDTDSKWPYEGKETQCHPKQMKREKAVTIDGHVDVPKHNETALMQSVSHTPTVVAVCCGQYLDQWHLYKSGIMGDDIQCTKPLDHSVLVVGYDTDNTTGEQYWLVKNSWGEHWGEEGFMRLKRNQTHRDGQAGLATFPGYAFKRKPNPGQMRRLVGGGSGVLAQAWEQLNGWLGRLN